MAHINTLIKSKEEAVKLVRRALIQILVGAVAALGAVVAPAHANAAPVHQNQAEITNPYVTSHLGLVIPEGVGPCQPLGQASCDRFVGVSRLDADKHR
jgi:hypothetical protein